MQKIIGSYSIKSILLLIEKYNKPIRFVIVGGINTGVDFFVFTSMHGFFGIDKLLCQISGYSAGIVNSFIMNKLWTFEDKSKKLTTLNQFFLFMVVNFFSLGVTLLGLQVLNEGFNINIYISKIIITVLAMVINYTGYKKFVFNKD